MLDSELMPYIGKFLERSVRSGFPDLGPFEVIQGAQPTQQGTPTEPTIVFIKLPDRPRGWPMTTYEKVPGKTLARTTQLYETELMVSCLKWQDPEAPNSQVVTASDLLNRLMMSFTTRDNLYAISKVGLNLLRIEEVTNEPFENDQHQFEFHPTFRVVVTHSRSMTEEVGTIIKVEESITRV